jgi:hypothetical protein
MGRVNPRHLTLHNKGRLQLSYAMSGLRMLLGPPAQITLESTTCKVGTSNIEHYTISNKSTYSAHFREEIMEWNTYLNF